MSIPPPKKDYKPLVCHGHSRPIVELTFSPATTDGFFLLSASKDGMPMIRNGQNGDWIGTFQGHKGAVWSVGINRPAWLAATGSADFTAKVWDAVSGEELHSFQHKHIVRCVSFARDAHRLATGGHERTIRVYDVAQPESSPLEMPGMPSSIRCLEWAPEDWKLLASLAEHPGIRVMDVRTGEIAATLPTDSPVTSIEITEDGSYITTCDGKVARIWDARRGQAPLSTITSPSEVESASFLPQKSILALGGADLWVHTYSIKTGAEIEVFKGHHGPVHAVRFGPLVNGSAVLASGSEDGTIRIQTEVQSAP